MLGLSLYDSYRERSATDIAISNNRGVGRALINGRLPWKCLSPKMPATSRPKTYTMNAAAIALKVRQEFATKENAQISKAPAKQTTKPKISG
jgi:hypothetical protein